MQQKSVEVWKPVPGYEGHYSVSTFGRVRSEARFSIHSGNKPGIHPVRKRILKPGIDTAGYRCVVLRINKKPTTMRVASIVARTFLNKKNGEIVDHMNRKRTDDRLTNLRLVTPTESARNRKIRSNNKSGYQGVCRSNTKKVGWRAQAMINGKFTYLGTFPTAKKAHKAYQSAIGTGHCNRNP